MGTPHPLCGPVLGIHSTNGSGKHSCPKLARSHCGRMPLPCHFCQYIAERVRKSFQPNQAAQGTPRRGNQRRSLWRAARDRGQQLGVTHQISNIHKPHPPAPLPLTTALAEIPLQPGLAWDLGVGRKLVGVLLYSLIPWNVAFRIVRPGFRGHPSLFPRGYVRRQPCTQSIDGDLYLT